MRVTRWMFLASIVVGAAACGGGGGGTDYGPACGVSGSGDTGVGSAADTLCQDMVSCGQLDAGVEILCRETLGVFVPDPAAALACIDTLSPSCDDTNTTAKVNLIASTCLYDTKHFHCSSSTTLYMASPATEGHPSVCKDLDCPTVCDEIYGLSGECRYDSSAGWDKCLCG